MAGLVMLKKGAVEEGVKGKREGAVEQEVGR